MADKNQLDHVCTHPPVPPPEKTAAKCALCMKPLAKEHMITRNGKAFCCDAAADQFFASDAQYQAYKAREGKGAFGRLVKKLVILIILIAIAAGAYWYFTKKDPSALDKLREQGNELMDR